MTRRQRLRRSSVSVCVEALSSHVLEVVTLSSCVAALTHQKPEITPPDFSTVQVTDIFQKLVRIVARVRADHRCCWKERRPHLDGSLTCGWLLLQGPLSVFCARARWGPVHVICLRRREGGLGLTLRGDSPVLVAGVVPGGCAAVGQETHKFEFPASFSGLKQGFFLNTCLLAGGGAKGRRLYRGCGWSGLQVGQTC